MNLKLKVKEIIERNRIKTKNKIRIEGNSELIKRYKASAISVSIFQGSMMSFGWIGLLIWKSGFVQDMTHINSLHTLLVMAMIVLTTFILVMQFISYKHSKVRFEKYALEIELEDLKLKYEGEQ